MGEVEKLVRQDQLIKILECPVCYEFPSPPIYTCERGHFMCSSCMKFLRSCSICRARITIARNFALESIIEGSSFKCRNAYAGCTQIIKGDNLNDHFKKCLFKAFDCTETNCFTKNLLPNEYLRHMTTKHHAIGCTEKLKDGKVAVTFIGMADLRYKPCYVNVIHPKSNKVATFFIFSRSHRFYTFNWATCSNPDFVSLFNVRFSLEGERNSIRWTLPVLPVSTNFNEIQYTGFCAAIPDAHLVPFYVKDTKVWNLKVELIQKEIQYETPSISGYKMLILFAFFSVVVVFVTLFFQAAETNNNSKGTSFSYGNSFAENNIMFEVPQKIFITAVDNYIPIPTASNNSLRQECFS